MSLGSIFLFIAFGVYSVAIAAQIPRAAPQTVSFATSDGGTIYGNVYGSGKRGVVLIHGGRFNKESWDPQARILAKAGYRLLSIDLRGYGNSTGPGKDDVFTAPLRLDVVAAVKYLRDTGTRNISLLGGSLGAGAASDAVIDAKPGEIKSLLALGGFLGHKDPAKINVPILIIITRDDANAEGPRLPRIRAGFDKVPGNSKELLILDGTAHAQFMFDADIGAAAMKKILDFLKKTNG